MISPYFEKRSQVRVGKEEDSVKRKDDLDSWRKIEEAIDVDAVLRRIENGFIKRTTVEALARLTVELADKLSRYDTILSDDASGRLVTLFLRKLVNKEREKTKKKSVNTFFVSTGRHGLQEVTAAVEDFIRKKNEGGRWGKHWW